MINRVNMPQMNGCVGPGALIGGIFMMVFGAGILTAGIILVVKINFAFFGLIMGGVFLLLIGICISCCSCCMKRNPNQLVVRPVVTTTVTPVTMTTTQTTVTPVYQQYPPQQMPPQQIVQQQMYPPQQMPPQQGEPYIVQDALDQPTVYGAPM